MTSYEEALEMILAAAHRLGEERVPISDSIGRVLARGINTPWDMPRFDQSAMDGFAVVASDLVGCSDSTPVKLRLVGEQRIGRSARRRVEPGMAIKIFTGSVLPDGADAVVMREYAEERDETVSVTRSVISGENVRRRGEEFRKGDEVLPAEVAVTPGIVGLLASLNRTKPAVYRRPSVTCITSGDELVEAGKRLSAGRIYDSNSSSMRAAIDGIGVSRVTMVRTRDDRAELEAAICDALAFSDLVLTVGGVSVGDRDYVREASRGAGVREVFWRVNVKPGKPVLFGRHGRRKLFFGLPGNPVSALVSFHQFVRPAILTMSGHPAVPPDGVAATFRGSYRKKVGRLEWVRCILSFEPDGPQVRAVTRQESHMLGGLAVANCLVELPQSCDGVRDGEKVRAVLLDWGS